MRTYERTHSWISFQFDLGRAHPNLWLGLGEAASKCEHISRVPLRPSTAQELHQLYLAKGAAATTAIEGNTLSEAEVLEGGCRQADCASFKAILEAGGGKHHRRLQHDR